MYFISSISGVLKGNSPLAVTVPLLKRIIFREIIKTMPPSDIKNKIKNIFISLEIGNALHFRSYINFN
ncbi:hypothetical protein A2733_01945 [Candidatus Nomurabacteria bacterium RIFCSPHIGHO2_01_FULL_40_20]|uniref:Uncharacterized protein n=1 Tax=Candidatus Nomurabacteria bacterium RIFCSPHIGHO2_01_FULL_40_20 TaxID=1801738 RepID=A0A1F6V1R6_9BACT|nr:MAG: hypothetical protein A2733_01945 [Candidatus Nomurabacteria bacterium RIFCSPHIGHO2_01_FULL_40_20]